METQARCCDRAQAATDANGSEPELDDGRRA